MPHLINQIDRDELASEVEQLRNDPAKCQRTRRLKAEWVGGTRSQLYNGDRRLFIGGDEDFGGAMTVTLASLLACEVDVIVTHATLRGIEIEKLSIEGVGDFNVSRYKGVASEPSPGYRRIEYTVHIKAKNATREQLEDLVKLCETASPVGDTLQGKVDLVLKVSTD